MIIRRTVLLGLLLTDVISVGLRSVTITFGNSADSEANLFPDPRVRQGFRLEEVRNRALGYASNHSGVLPADFTPLVNWFPASARPSIVARLAVDLWGTPISLARSGAIVIVRSAGPDLVWHTDDDVIETGDARAATLER